MTWTDERVEQLISLNDEGLTATQIAKKMDFVVTRNAVIGKLTRLGVKMARSPQPMLQRISRPRRRSIPKARPVQNKPVWKPKVEPLPTPHVDDIAVVTLLELEPHHCRFPVGDPQHDNFGFCGKQHVEGTSYCAGHLHRCTMVYASRAHPGRRGISRITTGDHTVAATAQEFLEPA